MPCTSQCTPSCGAGQFVVSACNATNDLVCGTCAAGEYSSAGDAACSTCPAAPGYEVSTAVGAAECACSTSFAWDPVSLGCVGVPCLGYQSVDGPNTWSQSGTEPCLPCSGATSCGDGAYADVTTCAPGSDTQCLPCPADYYSFAGDSTCSACDAGAPGYLAGTQEGQTSCSCATDYAWDAVALACVLNAPTPTPTPSPSPTFSKGASASPTISRSPTPSSSPAAVTAYVRVTFAITCPASANVTARDLSGNLTQPLREALATQVGVPLGAIKVLGVVVDGVVTSFVAVNANASSRRLGRLHARALQTTSAIDVVLGVDIGSNPNSSVASAQIASVQAAVTTLAQQPALLTPFLEAVAAAKGANVADFTATPPDPSTVSLVRALPPSPAPPAPPAAGAASSGGGGIGGIIGGVVGGLLVVAAGAGYYVYGGGGGGGGARAAARCGRRQRRGG